MLRWGRQLAHRADQLTRSAPPGGQIATSPPGDVANRTDVFVKGPHGTLNLYWAAGRGRWHSKRM